MDSLHFLADRGQELRDLIHSPENRDAVRAACTDVDVSLYHPEDGERPADGLLAVCVGCEGRLECLALALRAEDPEVRHGWYGGLGPADRDRIAAVVRLDAVATPLSDKAFAAIRLGQNGWRINDIAQELGCSRRTVQRYLRSVR
ncbi:WhiB family transcriptional regulator [Streptomyces sp. NBC_00876]|uniref:WhiB family transcriptional regulator n=1 Tax=Streptomyces sp. NBC_00876 TaxID=2975853 RepID=UPI00386F3AF6|nr:WhiB family transcriptional regulator [Streptomyces sp. NBC_00876]